ncbi:hypothetical protein GTR02_03065 [Kineococcus sp. R8]|uniref:hypothetical protein n=1 Tax=Kineococcus siccus TaxID=2696567 RepID=UPI0014120E10|nr:hypothetical protein [Kineococcus siccus]NAZ80800.1 hypothetical protein [Kineococcus siccus]
MRAAHLRHARAERSIAGQIGALLRSRPTSQTPYRDRATWFERKAQLFGRLAEHYGQGDPQEAAECRYLATVAAEEASRLRSVQALAR